MVQLDTKIKTLDILLIEDNEDDVFLTKLAAQKLDTDANLLIINNGQSAIQVLKEITSNKHKLPDLVLLDINLPALNGIEVLQYINEEKDLSSVQVVVFTSSDSLSDMECCYKHGAKLYMRKPNNINDFKETIKYMINYCFEEDKRTLL